MLEMREARWLAAEEAVSAQLVLYRCMSIGACL